MFARHFIDSLDFARNGRELRGEVAAAEMPRLRDMLSDSGGNIGYVVRGSPGKSGKPILEVTIDGSCQLICQRCLSGFTYPVHLISHLLLVQENELDGSPIEDDEVDSIPADKHLDVVALLEEEILLSLPFAPKHPPGACQFAAKSLEQPGSSAFAVLAGLKK